MADASHQLELFGCGTDFIISDSIPSNCLRIKVEILFDILRAKPGKKDDTYVLVCCRIQYRKSSINTLYELSLYI